MNKEFKEKWLVALRSGDYKQDIGYLQTTDGFCCLGVLCDITDNTKWDNIGRVAYYYVDNHGSHRTTLPYDILKASDMEANQCARLAKMNDDGKSFLEIADYIEENL